MLSPRWIAYDTPRDSAAAVGDASSPLLPPSSAGDDAALPSAAQAELEPGNNRQCDVRWSELQPPAQDAATKESRVWSGTAAPERNSADHTAPRTAFFDSTSLPYRTLTVECKQGLDTIAVKRCVLFLPAAFQCLPAAMEGDARERMESHRSAALSTLRSTITASAAELSTSPYITFRLVWMLARDAAPLQPSSTMRLLTAHPNLFAPVESHNPKALAAKMMAFVLPSATASSAAASASSSSSSAAATPPLSRYHTYLRSCGVGLLPETPLTCSLGDPSAMLLEVLAALVHAQLCMDCDWTLDARLWNVKAPGWIDAWQRGFDAACAKVQSWILSHLSQRLEFARFVLLRFQEMMPPRTVLLLLEQCLPLDWTDVTFQSSLVRLLLQSNTPAKEFPCSTEHSYAFWSALLKELELVQTPEIDDGFPTEIARLLEQRKKQAANLNRKFDAPHYFTACYREGIIHSSAPADESSSSSSDSAANACSSLSSFDLRSVTLRMSSISGFGSTTGLTLWPAGLLLCDFILQNGERLFKGKRVLELGVGIGLTSVLLHRAGVSTLLSTDGDEQVVHNLHANFRINGLPAVQPMPSNPQTMLGEGIFVQQLLWGSEESSELIRQAAPEVILSCDTIYLPEFHEALAKSLREALLTSATSVAAEGSVSSSSSSSASAAAAPASASPRVAYFAQANRNVETFSSYLRTFALHGLRMELVTADELLTSRFAYDRDCLQMHRITRMETESSAAAMAANVATTE